MSFCAAEMMLSSSHLDGDRIICLLSLVKEYTELCTHIMLSVLISLELVLLGSSMTISADLLRTQLQTFIQAGSSITLLKEILDA